MQKYLNIFIVLLIVFAVFELGYYISGTKRNLLFFWNTTPDQNGNTSNLIDRPESYRILYQDPSDTIGRTIIYEGKPGEAINGYGQVAQEITGYQVYAGIIESIEPIDGSEDEYIVLVDPINSSSIVHARLDYSSAFDTTDVRVEDIQESPSILLKIESLGLTTNVGKENMHKLMRVGDAVVLLMAPQIDEDTDIQTAIQQQLTRRDEEGIRYVARIFLRRIGGKTQILKELRDQ